MTKRLPYAYIYFNCFHRFPFPYAVCNIRQILVYMQMYVSVFTFVLTALQRYLAIVYNKPKLWIFSLKSLPLSLSAMWLVSLCLAIPVNYPGPYFAVIWRDVCIMASDKLITAAQIINSILIVLPLVAVFLIYVHIYWVVRKASARVQEQTGGRTVSNHHRRMARVLFILYLSASAVFIPYGCLWLHSQHEPPRLFVIPFWFCPFYWSP